MNFVTSQQATSVMSIGSRARLAMVLQGVDQATMRRLTNEAFEDLRTQMAAAGLNLISTEEARAMTVASGIRELRAIWRSRASGRASPSAPASGADG